MSLPGKEHADGPLAGRADGRLDDQWGYSEIPGDELFRPCRNVCTVLTGEFARWSRAKRLCGA